MRVISQDGVIDVPYENFVFGITKDNSIVAIRDTVARPQEICQGIVAEYSSKEKAEKAMEMLREEYRFENLFETLCSGMGDYPNKPFYYFQFPKDEDVEV